MFCSLTTLCASNTKTLLCVHAIQSYQYYWYSAFLSSAARSSIRNCFSLVHNNIAIFCLLLMLCGFSSTVYAAGSKDEKQSQPVVLTKVSKLANDACSSSLPKKVMIMIS